MANYDYKATVKTDIMNWLADNQGYRFNIYNYYRNGKWDKQALSQGMIDLFEDMDCITGYMTGYDTEEFCKEYLVGNEAEAKEVMTEAYDDPNAYDNAVAAGDYVNIDTNIRMYEVRVAVWEIVDELPERPKFGIEELERFAEEELDTAVNEVFAKLQAKLGIMSGDCPPDLSYQIDKAQEKLAELIAKTIQWELPWED